MASLFIGSVFFTGCAGLDTDTDENTSSATSSNAVSEEYGAVAKAVTDALNAEFATKDEAKAFLNNFSDNESVFRNALTDSIKDETINENVALYLEKISNAVDKAESPAQLLSNLDEVENEALENLTGDDLTAVMLSAETTRATFVYFNEVENDGKARGWGWFKRRAAEVAKAAGIGAALGTVTGAATGAIAGVAEAGIGAIPGAIGGAIIGGTVGGIASGIEEGMKNQ